MPAPASPGAMFAQRLSPHPTMGARTCAGSYAASPRPEAYAMTIRRSTVEQVFGTLKHWMGAAHFLTRTLGGEHLNEPSGAGLQPQARPVYTGGCRNDEGDEDGYPLRT